MAMGNEFSGHAWSDLPLSQEQDVHAQLMQQLLTIMNLQGRGSGSPAGMVLARPLVEILTVLLAINHYKTTN